MKCPRCQHRVIDFWTWGRGINAFLSVDCPNCGAQLRANPRTAIVLVVGLLLVAGGTVALAMALEQADIPERSARLIFAAIMIPGVFAMAFAEWWTGYYRLR